MYSTNWWADNAVHGRTTEYCDALSSMMLVSNALWSVVINHAVRGVQYILCRFNYCRILLKCCSLHGASSRH